MAQHYRDSHGYTPRVGDRPPDRIPYSEYEENYYIRRFTGQAEIFLQHAVHNPKFWHGFRNINKIAEQFNNAFSP